MSAAASASSAFLVPVCLTAALLHATWNAILKFVPDKLFGSLVMNAAGMALTPIAVVLAPLPKGSSWPLLTLSALMHVGYFLMLAKTFEIGDFNQVYPLARGLSPVVVAAIATAIGDPLSGRQAVGIAVVCGGLAVLVFSAGRPRKAQRAALLWAVATGLSIAVYTVVDGIAVRRSNTAFGYTAWMTFIETTLMTMVCLGIIARRRAGTGPGVRATVAGNPRGHLWRGIVAGVICPLAYGLVLWAQTRGALATVSALRETSVVFGAALGSLFLREPFGRYRILASVAIAGGILILEAA